MQKVFEFVVLFLFVKNLIDSFGISWFQQLSLRSYLYSAGL